MGVVANPGDFSGRLAVADVGDDRSGCQCGAGPEAPKTIPLHHAQNQPNPTSSTTLLTGSGVSSSSVWTGGGIAGTEAARDRSHSATRNPPSLGAGSAEYFGTKDLVKVRSAVIRTIRLENQISRRR